MSTPEQPASPPLTRKRMREIRNTGSTPIITADSAVDAQTSSSPEDEHVSVPTPIVAPATPAAPLPRPATPVDVGPPPVADASVDLGVSPLTRRQARQQERIRTASVPVITPDVAAAHAAAPSPAPLIVAAPVATADTREPSPVLFAAPVAADAAAPAHDTVDTPDDEVSAEVTDTDGATAANDEPAVDAPEPVSTDSGVHSLFGLPVAAASTSSFGPAAESDARAAGSGAAATHGDTGRAVSPALGADLLAGQSPEVALPPSFDLLLAQSTSGSATASNALIMSQAPEVSPIAPVISTGEVLITGTFHLPEGLGSTGHAAGTADGKEVDAVLVDGELPAHSSPTPIAASAAVSTVKPAGEVIQPPTPERGSRLMMALAITAGVLALALVGVLILAFLTGVFS